MASMGSTDTHRGVGSLASSTSQMESTSATMSSAPGTGAIDSQTATLRKRSKSPRAHLLLNPSRPKKNADRKNSTLPEPAAPAQAIGPCAGLFQEQPDNIQADEPARSATPTHSVSPSRRPAVPDDAELEIPTADVADMKSDAAQLSQAAEPDAAHIHPTESADASGNLSDRHGSESVTAPQLTRRSPTRASPTRLSPKSPAPRSKRMLETADEPQQSENKLPGRVSGGNAPPPMPASYATYASEPPSRQEFEELKTRLMAIEQHSTPMLQRIESAIP